MSRVLSSLLIVVLLVSLLPAAAHAQANPVACQQLADEMNKVAHHTPSPWLQNALAAGTARVWKNPAGTRIVVAVWVAECTRWLFAAFWGKVGQKVAFRTNFFPKTGWSYIAEQISLMRGISVSNWQLFGTFPLVIVIAPACTGPLPADPVARHEWELWCGGAAAKG